MAPFIYVAYLAARLHLPNNVYFPRVDADGDGSSDALWLVFENALLYAGLELLSFVELNAIVHRAFGFLSIILLQFQLEHFGEGFSFRFEWLKKENTHERFRFDVDALEQRREHGLSVVSSFVEITLRPRPGRALCGAESGDLPAS
ncbi:hypothetical protein Gpo141_00012134 [Globisporangium polare]